MTQPDTVRRQVDRIAGSSAFAGSEQLKRFLRLAVDRTLSGQPDQLKEYTLGVEVFGRPDTYDPKTDPIVRVQARRLRSKLDEYYAAEGKSDAVRISLPKGAYVPSFETVSTASAPEQSRSVRPAAAAVAALVIVIAILALARRSGPEPRTVAVLPLENLTGDDGKRFLADKMTEGLITELAKNRALSVASRTTVMHYRHAERPLPEIARALGVSTIVEGGVGYENGVVLVKLRAVDSTSDRKIWAESYQIPMDRISSLQPEAGRAIAAAIQGHTK